MIVVVVMVMTVMVPVIMIVIMAVAMVMIVIFVGADAAHMVVMAGLDGTDLGLVPDHLLAVFTQRAVHVGLAF
ncbi:MAG: hypothetical protein WC722_19130, partial [Rhodospirillales bacterium]